MYVNHHSVLFFIAVTCPIFFYFLFLIVDSTTLDAVAYPKVLSADLAKSFYSLELAEYDLAEVFTLNVCCPVSVILLVKVFSCQSCFVTFFYACYSYTFCDSDIAVDLHANEKKEWQYTHLALPVSCPKVLHTGIT